MAAYLKIKSNIDVSAMKSNKLFPKAQEKAAIQMLDWMTNGSMASPKKPPIRTGVLASSGSAFIDGKLIGVSPSIPKEGTATPNKSYNGKGVVWGFNTAYAAAMHEGKAKFKDSRGLVEFSPGPYSIRDPNMHPGNQWMTEHMSKDKDNYTKLIAEFVEDKMQ